MRRVVDHIKMAQGHFPFCPCLQRSAITIDGGAVRWSTWWSENVESRCADKVSCKSGTFSHKRDRDLCICCKLEACKVSNTNAEQSNVRSGTWVLGEFQDVDKEIDEGVEGPEKRKAGKECG